MSDDDTASSLASTSGGPISTDRWLITFLGLKPQSICYKLGDKTTDKATTAQHAALALLHLLGDRAPKTVKVFGTKESLEQSWPDLEGQFAEAACEVQCRELADVDDPDRFLASLMELVKDRSRDASLELILDLTHGFRHLPMLAYAGALYMAALRPEVRVVGCWYGMLDGKQGRFVDLLPLLKLPEWLYALRLLDERGDGTKLAALLQDSLVDEPKRGDDTLRCVNELAEALAWRCPLDAADAARAFGAAEKRLNRVRKSVRVAGADEIEQRLVELVSRYAPQETDDGSKKPDRRKKPPVSRETLRLHALMIDEAFARDDLPGAVGLLREWLVSWVWLAALKSEKSDSDGLDHGQRELASNLLGALGALGADRNLLPLLDETQAQIGAFWLRLSEARNALAHHGMRGQSIRDLRERGVKVREDWKSWVKGLLETQNVVLRPAGRKGVLLVSPLGTTLGVLQSALDCCDPKPQRLLVVTSREQAENAENLAREKLPSNPVTVITVQDPFRGVSELNALVQQAKKEVAKAEQVRVNLTGGTTLLGLAVERIARQAERLSVPVRRFVLVGPTAPSEQSSLVWVDDAEHT